MPTNINKYFCKIALRLHNISYKLAAQFAIKAEDGLHPKHRIMNYHRFFVKKINENDVVLDVGCGNGALAFDVAKKAKKVFGIDIDKGSIEIARQKYRSDNVEYVVGDATKDLPLQKYDVVILSNVLEHIENRIEFLLKVKGLAPKILIRVPMIDRDWIVPYKKELGVEWRLDKTHYIEYTIDTLREELKKADLIINEYSIQFGEIWAIVK
jgi:SAM-dependent methyltransferase